MTTAATPVDELERELNLPMLVFTGLGVTVGAGIFALVGEILGVAGDQAPLAFVIAGAIAGISGGSYVLLIRAFPRAGGEAVWVNRGIGAAPAKAVGLGVAATGVISSAVIAKAFAGYVGSIVDTPERATAIALVLALGALAWWGTRESVLLGAVVTVLEVGTLLVVIIAGLPDLEMDLVGRSLAPPDGAAMAAVLSAAAIAFFAFIGFEDIANMAEETVDPERTLPRAIIWTLGISMIIYVTLALVAASVPDRAAITGSSAPLAAVFESVAGREPTAISAIASIAMINGVLVQIVMASRMLYGMATDDLLPPVFAAIDHRRHTPLRATVLVVGLIIVLVAAFPLVTLARTTSFVVLAVFSLVNVSLWRLASAGHPDIPPSGRLLGAVGTIGSAALAAWQVYDAVT